MQVMLVRLMSKGEYLIVPKGTKFTGAGKLELSPIFFKKKKNQFFKPLFFVPDHPLSSHLRPFGRHPYTEIKVEYPRAFLLIFLHNT